jgi:hypothetical protein
VSGFVPAASIGFPPCFDTRIAGDKTRRLSLPLTRSIGTPRTVNLRPAARGADVCSEWLCE